MVFDKGEAVGVAKTSMQVRLCSGLILLLSLASCAPLPEYSDDRLPDTSVMDAPEEAEAPLAYSQAATDLLALAERQLVAQQIEQAAATAQRAIRIAPSDGRTYLMLAKARYHQQQYTQSKSLLGKARRLAHGDNKLLQAVARWESKIEQQL